MWTWTDGIRSTMKRRMTPLWLLCLLLPVGWALLGVTDLGSPMGPLLSPEQWQGYDRVAYAPAPPEALREITVTRLPPDVPAALELAGLVAFRAPHGTAFYVMRCPDTTRPGPWKTVMYVFSNQARPIRLKVTIANHLSAGVRAKWINEKLLWLQVWRGRIVSTDLILNIETAQFLYSEEANYGILLLSPEEQKRLAE
jgi:hypothetical protein